MSLNRNVFLDSLVKDSVRLNILFLNHSGSPAKLHTDMPSVDLLTNKKGTSALIDYCQSHKLVNQVILTPRFMRTKLQITFNDGSQLHIKIIRKMIRKSLDCLPVDDIVKASKVNDFGMLIPSDRHHFEFILLKYQFSESAFPDKYQKYFSSLDISSRTEIFRYIQPKYNLVFNVIEDLYVPKGGVLLKIMIGLRHLPNNTLLKMALRILHQGFWNLSNLFSQRSIVLPAKIFGGSQSGESIGKEPERKTANRKSPF